MGARTNLSFMMRLTLLIFPLVVMITHKHLHSKEPYSVWTKTNTRSVIILPSQIQSWRQPLRWFNVATHVGGSTDVAASELPDTPSTCEVSSLFHEWEVPVERPSCGSVTSNCKGFLNPPSCWYEYFQISFLHVNQLFLFMHVTGLALRYLGKQ